MPKSSKKYKSTLVSRGVTVSGKRTSVRLEPEMWKALRGVAKRERCTIHDLCTLVNLKKHADTSFTAAIRVFLMLYFRAASTEEGHKKAGHGQFSFMKERAGVDKSWSALKLKRALEQDREKLEIVQRDSYERIDHADYGNQGQHYSKRI
ncbi:MAG: hypothetical protein CMH31_04080 [Micavibrio sp.]|nr:hypothetical protein [Micavibrio sp.]